VRVAETKASDTLIERFERLNAIGASLSDEPDIERLLESILLAAKAITHADGGTLYRVSEDRKVLRFEIVRTDSLKIACGGTAACPVSATFTDLPLHGDDGEPNTSLVAAYSTLSGKTVNIADAYSAHGFDFSGTREFDRTTGYRSRSFLTVPMKNHENEVIAVLQLINAIDPESGAVRVFSEADQRLAESLASQAAVALTSHLLVRQFEELFEAFIRVINLAIDEKSPHTGGHCQRVPVLTMMLADAVEATTEGPFADFRMSEQDRYELKIAGLLHDCGKVTTPVHVVDKASKLQTIFDRIELIATRFEVARRDAELAMLRAIDAGASRDRARSDYLEKSRAIDADRDFLRRVNRGSEEMSHEDQRRVREISGKYRWRDGEGRERDFLREDEIENLTIRSGTLTAAERETINYHIVATIKMLDALPWPRRLRHVPEYAGGHHERIDGKGYPKGLRRDEMSVQARIMGLADIFEAITASDRPYKPGMKLSEALRILGNFSREGHIDPELLAVFVKQKVYLEYAKAYLDPAQIDERAV
jgi:HD-GYP domain-containing protein (c-di-GMP phosphodiesterase class II)